MFLFFKHIIYNTDLISDHPHDHFPIVKYLLVDFSTGHKSIYIYILEERFQSEKMLQ